jgi:hypothetical protein
MVMLWVNKMAYQTVTQNFREQRGLQIANAENQITRVEENFTGITATRAELREGGYFYQAKLTVLRDLWLGKKGLPTTQEEGSKKSTQDFLQNR